MDGVRHRIEHRNGEISRRSIRASVWDEATGDFDPPLRPDAIDQAIDRVEILEAEEEEANRRIFAEEAFASYVEGVLDGRTDG